MPGKDLIIVNARITTLDRQNPSAEATVIDAKRRRLIPGLIDSHIHLIRGGLNYNMELRWDGVPSLSEAMAMLKRQVDRTPAPQCVRVVGGFTEHQFAEKRLPKLDELNAVAPARGVPGSWNWSTESTRVRMR